MTRITIEQLEKHIKNSFLNCRYYRCDISIPEVFESLMLYSRGHEIPDSALSLDWATLGSSYLYHRQMVPSFQRDNTQWTPAMKIAFIENILMGFKSDILLYTVAADKKYSRTRSYVLDGLQRLSAILDFMSGKFNAFGYSAQELMQANIISLMTDFGIRVYTFRWHADAICHYIQMNEGITHSPGDIQRAIDCFENTMANECCLPILFDGALDSMATSLAQIYPDGSLTSHNTSEGTEFRRDISIGARRFNVLVGMYYSNPSPDKQHWYASDSVLNYTPS